MNFLIMGLVLILLPSAAVRAQQSIKFATLAPDGSPWMTVMKAMSQELETKTEGRLKFRFYAGGVSGDEKDVIRKIKVGELQAGGFTGVGLGIIAPEVRVLDAPWLFKTQKEIDYIHKKFDARFSAALEKGGFELLGFVDLGFVQIYSQNPVNGPDDIKKAKMWMWEGDPIAQAVFSAIGASPIPLSEVDVMSSLETGLINGVYGTPLAVVVLEWFTRLKYISTVPIAYASGAVLISKKTFDALTPADQKILKETSASHLAQLSRLTIKQNGESMKSLQNQGLILSAQPSAEIMKSYADIGEKARRSLVGSLYPAELLDQVEKSLATLRASNSKN
jgi:TRAP-type C4-dicarboxylate transport system substrate-binding protein